jgi:outer membrane protein assembly factor BamB
VSQDQDFTSVWSASLPDSGFYPVNSLFHGGRLFSASDGYVYELDPHSGAVLHTLRLTTDGDTTSLTTDGTSLFAGVSGHAYAIALDNWSGYAWKTAQDLGGTLDEQVNLLVSGTRLFAGSDGSVYELAPATGEILRSLQLTTDVGGDVTRMSTDGTYLYAGVHGYAYGVRLNDWDGYSWTRSVGGTLAYEEVSVLSLDGRLFAGSNGHVYRLTPQTGTVQHSQLLTSTVGAGDYDTSIITDGTFLYAGVHGYAYKVLVTTPPNAT